MMYLYMYMHMFKMYMFIPGDEVANTPQSWSSSTQRLVQGDSESLLSYQNSSVVTGEKAHYYHFYKCSPCVHE